MFPFSERAQKSGAHNGRRERVCRSKRFVDKAITHLWALLQKY
jgi:hypothetical protein